MSIIDTLITNRTQADVDALLALYAKPKAMWTTDEWNEFLLGNHRGAYNASDMNRVLDALDYLADRVTQFGYRKPEIKRPRITEVIPGTSTLPDGYVELEYIQSNGEQFINIEFIPQSEKIKVCAEFVLDSASAGQTIYGEHGNTTPPYGYMIQLYLNGGEINVNCGSLSTTSAINVPYSTGVKYKTELIADNGVVSFTINEELYTGTYSGELNKTQPLYLMACNMAGSEIQKAKVKFFPYKIYDNDVLAIDLVPCIGPNGICGMYDRANKIFRGNAGTGEFIAGYKKLDKNTLFYMDGNALVDISGNAVAVTNSGVTVSDAKSKFGGSSLYFNGSAYLSANVPITGDITLDCWVYQISFASDFPTPFNHLDGSYRGYYVHLTESKVYCDATNASGGMQSAQLASMPLGEWHHIAVTRSGTTVKFYVDGVLEATITNAHTANDVLWLGIMPSAESLTPFNGYIDELRVSNMVRWTENFTPPTESYLFQGIIPSQTVIRDYYKIGDRPPASELAEYLANVARIRAVLELPVSIPAAPEDISQRITIEDANNIEFILTAVETLLNRISLSWIYSGEAYSGEV